MSSSEWQESLWFWREDLRGSSRALISLSHSYHRASLFCFSRGLDSPSRELWRNRISLKYCKHHREAECQSHSNYGERNLRIERRSSRACFRFVFSLNWFKADSSLCSTPGWTEGEERRLSQSQRWWSCEWRGSNFSQRSKFPSLCERETCRLRRAREQGKWGKGLEWRRKRAEQSTCTSDRRESGLARIILSRRYWNSWWESQVCPEGAQGSWWRKTNFRGRVPTWRKGTRR